MTQNVAGPELDFDDDLMPRDRHVALANYIVAGMPNPDACQGFVLTRRFLTEEGVPDLDACLDWLREHHACCDCEIIWNQVPQFRLPDGLLLHHRRPSSPEGHVH